ncbi:MAG: efflux RND transporter periplasmic adaptor subunit, partial [Gemmatimonadaceae bacterium]
MSSRVSLSSVIFAVSSLAAVLLGACNGSTREAAAAKVGHDSAGAVGFTLSDSQRARLKIFDVKKTSFIPVLEVTGTVAFNGDRSTQVISQISGRVTRIIAQPGAEVRAGELLAEVASPDFASAIADYRKADAAWRNAKRIADRDEELFKNDALARSDLDQARSDLAAAQADLDATHQQLKALGVEDTTVTAVREGRDSGVMVGAIRAPIAGTVVEKLVTPGQVLEAGATPAY